MIRWLVVIVITFAIGHAFGFLMRPEPARRVIDLGEPALDPDEPPAAARAPRVVGRFTTLKEALDAIPTPPLPRGDGVLQGRVVDQFGNGVPGADVRCTPSRPEPDGGAIEDRVRERLTTVRWRNSGGARLRSGADGGFRFEGLVHMPHYLRAHKTGYQFLWGIKNKHRTPDQTVDITLRAVTAVTFRVFNEDGTEAAKARIRLRRAGTNHIIRWPHRGSKSSWVQPGLWQATIVTEEDKPLSAAVAVEVPIGKRPPPVVLRLGTHSGLAGTVAFVGTPHGRATVKLLRRVGEKPPRRSAFDRGWNTEVEDGAFHFYSVEPGSYWVALCLGEREPVDVRRLEIRKGGAKLDFRVDGRGDQFYAVRVLDGDGNPVSGARIRTFGEFNVFMLESEAGLYRLPAYEEGSQSVTVEKRGMGEVRLDLEFPVRGIQEVRFERRYDVAVTVRFAKGQAELRSLSCACFSVERDEEGRSARGGGRADVDPAGNAALRVPEGRWNLVVRTSIGEGFIGGATARKEITVSGDTKVEIELPRLYPVTLKFDRDMGDLELESEDRELGVRAFRHRQDGLQKSFKLKALPAGRYVVKSKDRSWPFVVPSKGPIRIQTKSSPDKR